MLKFHIIIIKFSIFTNKNSQSDMFCPKLKNTIVKIDIKSFSVQSCRQYDNLLNWQNKVFYFLGQISIMFLPSDDILISFASFS